MLNKKRNLEPLDNIPLNKEINRPNINIQLNNNEIVQTKCEICGLNILKKDENDHYICHELQGDLEYKLYNNYDFHLQINGNFEQENELLIKTSNNPIVYKLNNEEKIPQNNKNCSICFNEFKNNDDIMILPCMHYYHEKCINQWFLKEKICPYCKMIFYEKKDEDNENNGEENENDSEENENNNSEENENNNNEENENSNEENENSNEENENNNEENENNNEENENNNEENENKEEENENNNEENENKEEEIMINENQKENNSEKNENNNQENENNSDENENQEYEKINQENVNSIDENESEEENKNKNKRIKKTVTITLNIH